MTESEKELLSNIYSNFGNLDAIVVEGYDGVGKGRVLNLLSELLGVEPYRPDYNLWQKYDLRPNDRWKIPGFFWDIYSYFHHESGKPMLFDRGVLSGAVYNPDINIAKDYKKLLRESNVLHILVCCNKEDYFKFSDIRGESLSDEEKEKRWSRCKEITHSYKEALRISGVEYIVYNNEFSEEDANSLSNTCLGCGHYNYGICRHPMINSRVSPSNERCSLSKDKETQDIEVSRNGTEMHSV